MASCCCSEDKTKNKTTPVATSSKQVAVTQKQSTAPQPAVAASPPAVPSSALTTPVGIVQTSQSADKQVKLTSASSSPPPADIIAVDDVSSVSTPPRIPAVDKDEHPHAEVAARKNALETPVTVTRSCEAGGDDANDVGLTQALQRDENSKRTQLELEYETLCSVIMQRHAEDVSVLQLADRYRKDDAQQSTRAVDPDQQQQNFSQRKPTTDDALWRRLSMVRPRRCRTKFIPDRVAALAKMSVHDRIREQLKHHFDVAHFDICLGTAAFRDTSIRDPFAPKKSSDGSHQIETSAGRSGSVLSGGGMPHSRSSSVCNRDHSCSTEAAQGRSHSIGSTSSAWARDTSHRWNFVENRLDVGVSHRSSSWLTPRRRDINDADTVPGPGAYDPPIVWNRV